MANFMIDMRQVFFALGILLLIISYVNDHFNMYGYYFLGGAAAIIISFVCYIMYFGKRLH